MKTLPNDGVSADIENLDSLNDEALARLAQNGSSDAEHTLVVRFMPLVRIKARPYFLIGADHSDLVQEGSIGLFSAIRDYDCEKHTSFRTYAEVCIGNNIIAAIKRATRKKHFPLNSYISLDKPVFCGNYFTVTEVTWGCAPLYQYRKPSTSMVSPTFRLAAYRAVRPQAMQGI